ncbi:transglycosylase family protein [Streptomyces sp. NBC_00091]|uniref:transglycosylase family protein n=1 Tax=Streptomyces sp. NBC_00091 TaxID=2975648 RepID=UPI0022517B2B|nr:transglycosylase family protein [Streptomyces sp. NBC_00091]MCX5377962.1 transglycosylase family protein [Streptomyces sp. NBC_00091]
MLPGNGRHRRPRQVPAIVVTAGVTGSALALPLLAATGANAADTATWDKVADCESGGTWSANSGSGAYGGLQFTLEQWKNAGGLAYAERPDLASRSQQIAVAERVLESQGPQAWPLCSASAGLAQKGPKPDVDPGDNKNPGPVAPTPSRPDGSVPVTGKGKPSTDFGAPTPKPNEPSTGPSGLPDYPLGPSSGLPVMPEPDFTVTPTTPTTPTPTDPALPPTTPPVAPTVPGTPGTPTTPGTPSTPGAPATPTTPADPTAPVTPGVTPSAPATPGAPSGTPSATAADGAGKHRGPAAIEVPAAPGTASAATGYTVKPGDSLAAIADANGLKGGWGALYKANEQVIGQDADLIKPGQNLDLTKK